MNEQANDPIDERIQHALIDALGEDDGIQAYESIDPLLRKLWTGAHWCGVMDEREDVEPCQNNPFLAMNESATNGGQAFEDEVEALCDCDGHRANDDTWHDPACPTTPLRATLSRASR